jgi:bromodomain-containing factor 1
MQILKFLRDKDIAAGSFFQEPVDPVAHGITTYHQIITNPMDLGTVQTKIMINSEIHSPDQFAGLVPLVFGNAMQFNVGS